MTFDINLRIAALGVIIVSIILIVRSSRKSKMEIKDAVNWFFVALALFVCALLPELITLTSSAIGFRLPSNAIFMILIFLCFCIVYYLNIRISKLSMQLRDMVQNVSLLEKRLRDERDFKSTKQ